MTKTDLYSDYLSKLSAALESSDKDTISYLLEYIYAGELEQEDIDPLEEVISEATLFIELADEEYREMALKLITQLEVK